MQTARIRPISILQKREKDSAKWCCVGKSFMVIKPTIARITGGAETVLAEAAEEEMCILMTKVIKAKQMSRNSSVPVMMGIRGLFTRKNTQENKRIAEPIMTKIGLISTVITSDIKDRQL